MNKRFISIWFCHLLTDGVSLRNPELKKAPFVLSAPVHGKMIITAANAEALKQGLSAGVSVADAKAMVPSLLASDEPEGLSIKLLGRLAEWCIRFTPVISLDLPDGLILDATGCAHLWGGELEYLREISRRLKQLGFSVRLSIADTAGAAWAVAHYAGKGLLVKPAEQSGALLDLPPAALRLEPPALQRLQKLGLRTISSFMDMPRPALRRRFGEHLLLRLDQALGYEDEYFLPVRQLTPYHERLPSMEPIRTLTGIEIAVQKLLEKICERLGKENKGLRKAILLCYRLDGKTEKAEIGTNRPSGSLSHLFKLFSLKIGSIEPALGIELFTMEASGIEDMPLIQDAIWKSKAGLADQEVSELLDRLAGKVGISAIKRYLPAEHYWPERSVEVVNSLAENAQTAWRDDLRRPVKILAKPAPIEVTAPIPDYPPMRFNYQGRSHVICKSDGPERIEREWWMDQGEHRDYYQVEDEAGKRYWLFRSGHYNSDPVQKWFLHGFFA